MLRGRMSLYFLRVFKEQNVNASRRRYFLNTIARHNSPFVRFHNVNVQVMIQGGKQVTIVPWKCKYSSERYPSELAAYSNLETVSCGVLKIAISVPPITPAASTNTSFHSSRL
jgi:hypothetical protein